MTRFSQFVGEWAATCSTRRPSGRARGRPPWLRRRRPPLPLPPGGPSARPWPASGRRRRPQLRANQQTISGHWHRFGRLDRRWKKNKDMVWEKWILAAVPRVQIHRILRPGLFWLHLVTIGGGGGSLQSGGRAEFGSEQGFWGLPLLAGYFFFFWVRVGLLVVNHFLFLLKISCKRKSEVKG